MEIFLSSMLFVGTKKSKNSHSCSTLTLVLIYYAIIVLITTK